MKEKWVHEIQGYENIEGYKIREDGRVFSCVSGKRKELKGYPNTKGYLLVDFSSKKRAVKIHRVVALAFIENPKNKPQVNHIDCNKRNNSVGNLQWVTNGENQKHAFRNGLNKPHTKELNYQYFGNHKNCKKVRQMDLQGNEIAVHKSIALAGRSLGKEYSPISKVCNKHGRSKTAYGYKWEFIHELGSTTISKESTLQANGNGNSGYPYLYGDNDIV